MRIAGTETDSETRYEGRVEFETNTAPAGGSDFGGDSLAGGFESSGSAWRAGSEPIGGAAKRVFDLIAASVALLLFAPLMALIALAIMLESRGSPVFRQERTGLGGKTFTIFKFRSMRLSPTQTEVMQVERNDDRVTALGRLLRQLSLDELPQLINVLRGDMSLVGPRPHAVSHDREFGHSHYRYWRRGLARPGMTGLAQVSGSRGPIRSLALLKKRTLFDLDYVDNWSFSRDVLILAKTVVAVWSDPEAY